MLFISSLKLFPFSRHLNLEFIGNVEKRLVQKDEVNFKVYDVTSLQQSKQLQYTFCAISQEVKTIRQKKLGQLVEYNTRNTLKCGKMW